jgi:hypothetical protein
MNLARALVNNAIECWEIVQTQRLLASPDGLGSKELIGSLSDGRSLRLNNVRPRRLRLNICSSGNQSF